MKSSAAASENFLNRTTEIDVDHVETSFDQLGSAGGKLLWFRPHQLATDRVITVADVQEIAGLFPIFPNGHEELIQHHLVECVSCPMLPCQSPHRPVTVARQGRLDDGEANRHVSQMQWFQWFQFSNTSSAGLPARILALANWTQNRTLSIVR